MTPRHVHATIKSGHDGRVENLNKIDSIAYGKIYYRNKVIFIDIICQL